MDGCLSQDPELESRHVESERAARALAAAGAESRLLCARRIAVAGRCCRLPRGDGWGDDRARQVWLERRDHLRACARRRQPCRLRRRQAHPLHPRHDRWRLRRMVRHRFGALERAPAGSPSDDGRGRDCDAAAERSPVRDVVDVLLPAAEQRLFARQYPLGAGQHAQGDGGRHRPGCRPHCAQSRRRTGV